MAKINYKALVESYQKWPDKAPSLLEDAIQAKESEVKNFSFLGLFEAFFGWGEVRACRSDPQRLITKDVFEFAGAVSTANFQSISGQIIYQMTLQGYESEGYPFSDLIPTQQGSPWQ